MPQVAFNAIQLAVIAHVEAATGLLPIKHQLKTFDDNGGPFAELIVSPMDTQSETIDGGDVLPGYILFNLYAPKNTGAVWPTSEAQKLLNLFPRDFTLSPIRIKRTGSIRPPFEDGKWQVTPALVEYEADSCQT